MAIAKTTSDRLTKVEVEVAQVRVDIGQLASSIDEVKKLVGTFSNQLIAKDKTNWNVIYAGLGLAVTVLVLVLTGVTGPMAKDLASIDRLSEARHNAQEVEIRDVAKAAADSRAELQRYTDSELARYSASNKNEWQQRVDEIETQFRWGTDVMNSQDRQLSRLIGMLWEKVYGQQIPQFPGPNVGPMKSEGR